MQLYTNTEGTKNRNVKLLN